MDKSILIYVLIVGFAILSSIIRRNKQKAQRRNYKKPQPRVQTTQKPKPKPSNQSLDDLLETILGQPTKTTQPQKKQNTDYADNKRKKSEPMVHENMYKDEEAAEIADELKYDTELEYDSEMEDYDLMEDHHVHGELFDNPKEFYKSREEYNEWRDTDWRKAIIASEILKRPEYWSEKSMVLVKKRVC